MSISISFILLLLLLLSLLLLVRVNVSLDSRQYLVETCAVFPSYHQYRLGIDIDTVNSVDSLLLLAVILIVCLLLVK